MNEILPVLVRLSDTCAKKEDSMSEQQDVEPLDILAQDPVLWWWFDE